MRLKSTTPLFSVCGPGTILDDLSCFVSPSTPVLTLAQFSNFPLTRQQVE